MANVTIDLELLTKQFDAAIKKSIKNAEDLGETISRGTKNGADGMDELTKKTGRFSKFVSGSFSTAQVAVGSFIGSLASNVALSAINALGSAVANAGKDFLALETAQVGVAKTTNLTTKEVEELTNTFTDLSKSIPVSVKDLLDLSQVAGQLGVTGTQNLSLFSETISKLAVASDLAGEEGAKSLIRILNVTGEGVENIGNFASAIVDLGNNFAASESEIANVATEVARSTSQFKIGAANVAGISTALRSLGIQAQLGGSVVGKAFRTINDTIQKGGQPLKELSKLTNLTGEQLKKTFEEDATKGFQIFIEALGKIPSNKISLQLEALKLTGDEVNKVLPVLASRSDLVGSALDRANQAFKENIALNQEADRAFTTLSSRLSVLGNNFTNLGTTIASIFAPAFGDAVDVANDFFDLFSNRNSVEETEVQLRKAQLALDSLNRSMEETGATSESSLGRARDAAQQNVIALQQLADEQSKASNASTNLLTNTGLLEAQLKGLNDQLLLVNSGFGQGLDLNAEQIITEIDQVKNKLKELNEVKENNQSSQQRPEELDSVEERNKTLIQKELELQIALKQIREQARLEKEESTIKLREAENIATEEDFTRLAEIETEKIRIKQNAEDAKAKLISDSKIKQLQLNKNAADAELSIQQKLSQSNIDAKKREIEAKKALDAEEKKIRESNFQSASRFLNAGIALSKKGSDQAKALSITDAIINTYAGATRAYKDLPYPSSVIASASIIAQGLANVSRITNAGSFEQGGIIPGASFSGDRLTANVNSGEMILNKQQQSQLFNQANGGGTTSSSDMSQIVEAIRSLNITLVANDNEIARSTSRGVSNGIVIGVSE